MLQRAASNAYSWWWASRIRTSQSKWLDSNLEEMDDRVKIILKLLDEEADSFAKRAEMYYKRRPEVISNVEEAYRAYRALAERYDHISGELHKANHTIAAAFPEQVQYAMLEDGEEDDNEHYPKAITPIDPSKIRKSTVEGLLKRKKKEKERERGKGQADVTVSKEKAQEEINRLQKAILVLQTEKEFVKSSYESGIARYWEIEKQMADMQEEAIFLQEESGASSTVIDDDEARALMTATALKSCEDAIVKLQEQQKESAELARVESERICSAIDKLNAIRGDYGESQSQSQTLTESVNSEEVLVSLQREQVELQAICEKVRKHFEMNLETSVEEIAEKIDELVGKVIELEMTVSSLTAQINQLSVQNGEMEKHLRELEEEKIVLKDDSDELSRKLEQAEEELQRVQALERSIKERQAEAVTDFTEVVNGLRNLSKKFDRIDGETNEEQGELLENVAGLNQIEELGEKDSSKFEQISEVGSHELQNPSNFEVVKEELPEDELHEAKDSGGLLQESEIVQGDSSQATNENSPSDPAMANKSIRQESIQRHKDEISTIMSEIREIDSLEGDNTKFEGESESVIPTEKEGILRWQELLLNGLEGREKILLTEYTSILRNYKETKRQLSEIEKKNEAHLNETAKIITELRCDNALKDEEIRALKQLLSSSKHDSDGIAVISDASKATESPKKETKENPPVEVKFKGDIDLLLEENFKFMLRLSASLNRTQEFETKLKDIQTEMRKPKDEKSQESGSLVKPETQSTEKRLRELKTEIEVWLEQIGMLRQELQARVSSLSSTQEELSEAVRTSSATDGARLSVFQGEVLSLQQGNDRVENELQAGLDLVSGIRSRVEESLRKLHEDFDLPGSESESKRKDHSFRHFPSKTRVPLRNFLFGPKPKKKPSLFDCINPALQKQYSDMKGGSFV